MLSYAFFITPLNILFILHFPPVSPRFWRTLAVLPGTARDLHISLDSPQLSLLVTAGIEEDTTIAISDEDERADKEHVYQKEQEDWKLETAYSSQKASSLAATPANVRLLDASNSNRQIWSTMKPRLSRRLGPSSLVESTKVQATGRPSLSLLSPLPLQGLSQAAVQFRVSLVGRKQLGRPSTPTQWVLLPGTSLEPVDLLTVYFFFD
ncbi:unnamed protein product [Protopolystoma xenopodis]|uniref:Uncharacterized protein n=1 Tax=Protopolystoma xenopodis TaxID=117903 RepID=A0A448WNW0_9PLAT|nr:unnamed protein product [Protopolystoma xenopodis]